MYLAGVDIGGTKCAACIGRADGEQVEVLCRAVPRATREYTPAGMLEALAGDLRDCLAALPAWERAEGIGISCGGPLDSRAGIVLSPPNLSGWDAVPAAKILSERTGLPAWLCNDANAGALAEWQYGAGRGCRDLVFLTFGTGLGAGLILGGRLYEGASGMAGELGHIRLEAHGPVGYGKAGSFEGFCSGGGDRPARAGICARGAPGGEKPRPLSRHGGACRARRAQGGGGCRRGRPARPKDPARSGDPARAGAFHHNRHDESQKNRDWQHFRKML